MPKWNIKIRLVFILSFAVFALSSCGDKTKILNTDPDIYRFCEDFLIWELDRGEDRTNEDLWACVSQKGGFTDENGEVVHPSSSDWKWGD